MACGDGTDAHTASPSLSSTHAHTLSLLVFAFQTDTLGIFVFAVVVVVVLLLRWNGCSCPMHSSILCGVYGGVCRDNWDCLFVW